MGENQNPTNVLCLYVGHFFYAKTALLGLFALTLKETGRLTVGLSFP